MATSEKINVYSEITPEIRALAEQTAKADLIDSTLYTALNVKRGLRDLNGKGVLAGLTNISEVRAKKVVDGREEPDYGHLFYRGYSIESLIGGIREEKRFGFEEVCYLLLFGELPSREELESFSRQLVFYRSLPKNFVRDVVMKAPSGDMMNMLARSVLTLYSYDDHADDVSLPNVLRQCMQLISLFPMLSIYGYQANSYYNSSESLFIHQPLQDGSLAENLLHILRPDGRYTELEARILDICLILHMDHGGGNNSTFTTHVVSSTMTDTYSTMAAALGSLKGPRHGGANIKVVDMFEDMKAELRDWQDDDEVRRYLDRLLNREAFDRAGLIYGVGHAVYSLSDPRAVILKAFVDQLATVKGRHREFELYDRVERLAPAVIAGERQMYKGVSVNVDFYSGFVYQMLGLPKELFTPIFAIARIVGWSAHRMEELANNSKIIRPAYTTVIPDREYVPMGSRCKK
ncbi:citrate/2-methylcitrate synthase [Lachnoclostridium sp. Marseille-P6806]|uniref:citrate/2-methylcitrate synthase n=1 Tax=Lachnoclostridium sp. Marseille-P6806 TaxID=2364793 RepID=UPI0010300469|nr:citrate/2-methylcitrate synthase [Lachnoclostridium sp. Marseille-P6806]